MQHQISFQDLLSGKMSQEPSQATKDATSKPFSKRSPKSEKKEAKFLYLSLKKANGFLPEPLWETAGALPGESMMLNFGEFPSVARESTLSQTLEANVPEKYYLSPKACQGILRRAEKRGKELPKMLKEALEEVIALASQTEDTNQET